MFRIKNRIKAFTLVELLVVISIISVLSSTTMASLNASRKKARDAVRISDLKEIEKTVELYYDQHGRYPELWAISNDPSWSNLETKLSSFIDLPSDPVNSSGYYYYYEADPIDNYQTYGLQIRFESSSNNTLAQNDGGWSSSYYELGQQPKICKAIYGRWFNGGEVSDMSGYPGELCNIQINIVIP